ncbi:uncharacterized protein LOC126888452 [Diabrotica virgifera virgifera]|uniref:Uncharacterized protein n=1 Tax=Diabrotica virgifera virgifera TaxID=50390 RepID=A0ABM5KRA9_DIAVI|nr:uncharacterized protein LOC126888452 [Diabrotica virgifera virgifera]
MQVFSFISILLLFGMWSAFPQPNSVSATPLPIDWNTFQVTGCVGCFLPASTYATFKPISTTTKRYHFTDNVHTWYTFKRTSKTTKGYYLTDIVRWYTFKPISTTTKGYYFTDKIGWYV